MQMRHRKTDNEPEHDCQVTLFVANAQKVCENCLHARYGRPRPGGRREGQVRFHPAVGTESPTPEPSLSTGRACALRATETRCRPPHSLRPSGPRASRYVFTARPPQLQPACPARPAHIICIVPSHLICISPWSIRRVPSHAWEGRNS
ncbi:uncharacterized protein LOC125087678 isoform X2 [Lutra lutra]|uniref:uncharacterized protein LOC125087678 isoform X2 n=1 Tax=Lutra lutra TaxID=9657 RepID=UPI001FD2E514|nr:uncharacterized protein LOC125087678 isoform X2 [Lutra lutra]